MAVRRRSDKGPPAQATRRCNCGRPARTRQQLGRLPSQSCITETNASQLAGAAVACCRSHSINTVNLAHNQLISVANPPGHHRSNGGGLTPLPDELLQLVFHRLQAAQLLSMASVSLNWSVSHRRYISLSSTVGSSLWYKICCPALPRCL